MEAAPYIGFLFAPGAVRNIDLNDCPGTYAFLCHAMRRDEYLLPLDARPTVGAVRLLVHIVKAGSHQEQSLVRYKSIHADVMRCLQSALTFHRAN